MASTTFLRRFACSRRASSTESVLVRASLGVYLFGPTLREVWDEVGVEGTKFGREVCDETV